MNIQILVIVLIDYFRFNGEFNDLDSFLQEYYQDEFIKDFYKEYEELNLKISDERRNISLNQKYIEDKSQNTSKFEYN